MIESIGVLLILCLLPIVVPVGIGARGNVSEDTTEFTASIRVLLGLVALRVVRSTSFTWNLSLGPVTLIRREIGASGAPKGEDEAGEDPESEETDGEGEAALGLFDRLGQLSRYLDLALEPAYRLLRRLAKTVWLRRVDVSGDFGAGSPDATGKLSGVFYALQGALGKRAQLDLRPDFVTRGFRGSFRFEVWFSISLLIVAVLIAGLTVGMPLGGWYLRDKFSGLRRPRTQSV